MPGLAAIAEVECEDVSRLPGPHVTPEHMWRLARRAAAWLERPDVQGLVVTHGTDTLEETAYLLDLLLLSPKPVVIVGAIRTISEPGWDGPANLLAAVRVAAAPESSGRGVLVVMNEQILTAHEAQKIHTESAGSFASPEFGPVGVLDAGKVVYVRHAVRHGDWTRRRRRHRPPRRTARDGGRSGQVGGGRRRSLPALQPGRLEPQASSSKRWAAATCRRR